MAAKQPTSISLSDEQRKAISDAQKKLERDGIRPSRNDVMRAVMALGLSISWIARQVYDERRCPPRRSPLEARRLTTPTLRPRAAKRRRPPPDQGDGRDEKHVISDRSKSQRATE